MKTGDHVQDGNGRSFQVGQLLGRGLWGKCYLVRDDSDATEWVLKVPLGDDDLPREPPRLAEACREIAREQGRLLDESDNDALVDVAARFIADDGSPAILMPRYPETLERRMADSATMDEILQTLSKALNALQVLKPTMAVHGAIKPANIMLDDDGNVRLMDPVTPTLKRYLPVLARRDGYLGDAYLPQEIRHAESDPAMTASADTFSLAMTLYRAANTEAENPVLPDAGLQKGDVQALKDRFHNRLKAEPSNPRFHSRLADRAAAIVNRAISIETSPSPPFRFNKVSEFGTRLAEVVALVHPTIAHVGKLILNRPPANNTFATDEDVQFSCTVGATQGVETHEEIAAGIAVFDQERQERLRNISCSYTVDRHPSGRFRFSFRIADLPPGHYLVRVAYTIRDSGHEPITAEEGFMVNAAPGYVPPRTEPERQPIALDRGGPEEEHTVTAEVSPPGLEEAVTANSEMAEPAPVTTLHASEDAPDVEVVPEETTEPAPAAEDATTPPVPLPINDAVADAQTEEPVYQGAGRWSELPLPNAGGADLPESKPKPKTTIEPNPEEQGPVAELLARGLSLIRSDAYTLFLGAAGLIILILLAALWLLPSS